MYVLPYTSTMDLVACWATPVYMHGECKARCNLLARSFTSCTLISQSVLGHLTRSSRTPHAYGLTSAQPFTLSLSVFQVSES